MIRARLEPTDTQLDSTLGQVSPLVKLAIAFTWLVGLAITLEWAPPLVLTVVAFTAGVSLGRIPTGALLRLVAPLWLAAVGIGVFNALFSVSNGDPAATQLFTLGPVRLTEQAVTNGLALALRVVAIGCVGAVFAATTDPTRLADALVQQGRVPERFAFGALAAYGAIPRFGDDLMALRQARRIRGLGGSWHPRLLVGLLVLAIRHGDRLALAMDARGLGTAPRTRYRTLRWRSTEADLAIGAAGVLLLALWLGSSI